MEKDKTLVEKAKKEGLVVYDNFAKIRWKFDVVFSNDVLEHLTEIELQHALDSMIKRIASGGRLILKWSTTQKDDFYKYNTGKTGHDHCCPWPLNYVKQLLKSKGLKIEESGKGWKLFRGSLRLPFWLQRILIPKSNDEAYIIAKR